uniref:Uncharacterized protein n=1 Tax=Oryza barthii TaxID=65489 RepID=A0A0D3G7K3_9ORYZ
MEPGNAMDSAIEYARVSSDAMDSGARVDAAYQCVFQEYDGDALKANITAMGPLVLPTWDELLFVLLLPPLACLLKLITAMKLKFCCCLFSAVKCTLKMN